MRITVRPAVVLGFSTHWGRAVAFAVLAALRGALYSYFVFAALCYYPVGRVPWLEALVVWLARLLELPIALVGFVFPFLCSPFSFLHTPPCFPDPDRALRTHMLAGVLGYLFVFHIPVLARVVRRRLSRPAA